MPETNLLTMETIREKEYKIDDILYVKPYLSLSAKKVFIQNILDICLISSDINKIDFSLKEFAFEYILVARYSNIDFEVDDVLQLYDELKENGVIDLVLTKITISEKEFISRVLQKEIDQIQLVDNSLANIVSKQLNKLVEKLPDQKGLAKLIKDLPKQFNKIDSSKLKYLADAIGWKAE